MSDEQQTYNITAAELQQFIEQYESLDSERKGVSEQMKDVLGESKARGYDTKIMRKIIALRKKSADAIAEEDALMEMYKSALGME